MAPSDTRNFILQLSLFGDVSCRSHVNSSATTCNLLRGIFECLYRPITPLGPTAVAGKADVHLQFATAVGQRRYTGPKGVIRYSTVAHELF